MSTILKFIKNFFTSDHEYFKTLNKKELYDIGFDDYDICRLKSRKKDHTLFGVYDWK